MARAKRAKRKAKEREAIFALALLLGIPTGSQPGTSSMTTLRCTGGRREKEGTEGDLVGASLLANSFDVLHNSSDSSACSSGKRARITGSQPVKSATAKLQYRWSQGGLSLVITGAEDHFMLVGRFFWLTENTLTIAINSASVCPGARGSGPWA